MYVMYLIYLTVLAFMEAELRDRFKYLMRPPVSMTRPLKRRCLNSEYSDTERREDAVEYNEKEFKQNVEV